MSSREILLGGDRLLRVQTNLEIIKSDQGNSEQEDGVNGKVSYLKPSSSCDGDGDFLSAQAKNFTVLNPE